MIIIYQTIKYYVIMSRYTHNVSHRSKVFSSWPGFSHINLTENQTKCFIYNSLFFEIQIKSCINLIYHIITVQRE